MAGRVEAHGGRRHLHDADEVGAVPVVVSLQIDAVLHHVRGDFVVPHRLVRLEPRAEVHVLDRVTLALELRLDAFAEFVGVRSGHKADSQHVRGIVGSADSRRLQREQRDSGE